jgi:DUF1680 family protein
MLTDTTRSPYAKAHPLDWDAVSWTDGFWAHVGETCADHTVPHIRKMFESAETSHIVENFRVCAGEAEGTFGGTDFGDGDFYKLLEAAIYVAAENDDEELFSDIDRYIDLIGRCQQDDGYLSTKQIIGERQHNGVKRFGNINDFEVYNFGHLCTAAALHYRVTGKRNFLEIAMRAADYLARMYKSCAETGEVQTAVCPSHYMGLVELYRATGEQRYLDTAELAIRLRDLVKNGTADNQDRLPLHEQDKIEGHAVRANYLYAGVADLYLEKGANDDLDVVKRMWRNLVDQKLYITGGCGAIYNGAAPYGNFFSDSKTHQAYGYEYQLPNVTAYNETCASVGLVMWAYRMFQIEPRAEYFDIIERAMLNVNLAAMNLGGDRFFYENMLRRTKSLPYELIWPLTRKPYLMSYCCPPNLARLLAETSEYAYLVNDGDLFVGLYGSNTAHVRLANGTTFDIEQKTSYPYDGDIDFTLTNIKAADKFKVCLRIPGWLESGHIAFGADCVKLRHAEHGYYETVSIDGASDRADIHLHFDMPVRLTVAHPFVEEDCNQVAVERGPLVYCVESPDVDVESLDDVLIDPSADFSQVPMEIAGKQVYGLRGTVLCRQTESTDGEPHGALYRTLGHVSLKRVEARLIPYFAWDNRGWGEMRIWMPVAYGMADEEVRHG